MKRITPWLIAIAVVVGVLHGLPAHAMALPLPVFGLTAESETTTSLNELMKVVFDDTIIPDVVNHTELLDWFPDGKIVKGTDGRYFETSHLYQNPGSVGSRSEGGFIPEPSGAKAKNGRVTLKKIMGSLQETAEVLKKIKDKGAFADWSEDVFPRFREDLGGEYDRQLIADGSGIRARVNDATPATTLTVDSTLGIAGLDRPLMQFRRGMHLRASPNHNGTSPRTGTMTVTDIDWDNDAIIVDALATSLADDDYLFEGDDADNSAGKDMMGLYGLVDNGDVVQTLQNIDRSTNRWFQSFVDDANGEVITEFMMIDTDRQARLRGAGKVDGIIMSEDAMNAVWEDLKLDRQITDPRSYTGGRKGVDILFGGTRTVELRTASRLPSSVVFGLQRDQIVKHILHEWEWDDTTGSIWKQVITSAGRKDEFFAYGSAYGEIAQRSSQRHWRLENFALEAT